MTVDLSQDLTTSGSGHRLQQGGNRLETVCKNTLACRSRVSKVLAVVDVGQILPPERSSVLDRAADVPI